MAIKLQALPDHSEAIAELTLKLKAREGKPGFAKNCQALRDEIARLKGE